MKILLGSILSFGAGVVLGYYLCFAPAGATLATFLLEHTLPDTARTTTEQEGTTVSIDAEHARVTFIAQSGLAGGSPYRLTVHIPSEAGVRSVNQYADTNGVVYAETTAATKPSLSELTPGKPIRIAYTTDTGAFEAQTLTWFNIIPNHSYTITP